MIYLILAVTFAVRAWPRLICKNVILSDTYYHLFCARLIRENRFRIPGTLPRVVMLPEYSYPFGYHLFLALFPESARRWLERWTGAFFDTLNVLLCYWFSVWAMSRLGAGSEYLPLLVAALMSVSPALLRLGSGPRAYNGSPRVIGQTLYLAHLLLAFPALQTGSWPALAGSLAAGAALMVTAKFGTQVLVFFGIIFCLGISPLYALLLLGCVAVAALITRGRALNILAAQINHSIFYCRHLQRIFLHKRRPRFRPYWDILVQGLRYLKRGDFHWLFPWYFDECHPVLLFVTIFTQFLLLPVLLFTGAAQEPVGQFLLLWSAAGLCWFVLTKTKALAFLGEGERYLEYALYPSLFLTVAWLAQSPIGIILVGAFLVYSVALAIYFGQAYVTRYRQLDRDFSGTLATFSQLNQLEPGVIMAIGPFHWQALCLSRFPVLTFGGNFDPRLLPLEEFLLVCGNYPHPSEHLEKIIDQYQVRYVVSDPTHLAYYFKKICGRYDAFRTMTDVLADTECLVIYRVHSVPGQKAA